MRTNHISEKTKTIYCAAEHHLRAQIAMHDKIIKHVRNMNYVNCNVGVSKEINVITKSHIIQNLGRVEH
jgi:hypothetical protein